MYLVFCAWGRMIQIRLRRLLRLLTSYIVKWLPMCIREFLLIAHKPAEVKVGTSQFSEPACQRTHYYVGMQIFLVILGFLLSKIVREFIHLLILEQIYLEWQIRSRSLPEKVDNLSPKFTDQHYLFGKWNLKGGSECVGVLFLYNLCLVM